MQGRTGKPEVVNDKVGWAKVKWEDEKQKDEGDDNDVSATLEPRELGLGFLLHKKHLFKEIKRYNRETAEGTRLSNFRGGGGGGNFLSQLSLPSRSGEATILAAPSDTFTLATPLQSSPSLEGYSLPARGYTLTASPTLGGMGNLLVALSGTSHW